MTAETIAVSIAVQIPVVALFAWAMLRILTVGISAMAESRREYLAALSAQSSATAGALTALAGEIKALTDILVRHDEAARFMERSERREAQ